jgi:hypothetical protein
VTSHSSYTAARFGIDETLYCHQRSARKVLIGSSWAGDGNAGRALSDNSTLPTVAASHAFPTTSGPLRWVTRQRPRRPASPDSASDRRECHTAPPNGAVPAARSPDRTGSYDLVWWLAILFGVLSALINLPIGEKPVARMAPLPA